eukprot:scaffold47875_cov63-Phaeocystis_antarctica.AAC.2
MPSTHALRAHCAHRSSSGKCYRAWRACRPPRLRRWSCEGRRLRCGRHGDSPRPWLSPTLHSSIAPINPDPKPTLTYPDLPLA